MKSRLGIGLFLLAVTLIVLTACGGSNNSSQPATSVTLSQSTTLNAMNAGSSGVTFTATVSNGGTNTGVAWSLTPGTGCGTLAPSGTTALYTPPAESALNADCTATITATAAADSTKTASSALTIKAVAITLPNGQSATPATAANGSPVALAASLANDASGSATLNWNITSSGGGQSTTLSSPRLRTVSMNTAIAPKAQTSSCGNLSGATGTSVTYTPPASGPCSAVVTVATSVNPNVVKTFNITVNPALAVTTTALTANTIGSGYTVGLAATGGIPPYSWGVSASSALPPGLTLSASGVLSGTPTAAGAYNFSVTVRDSNSTPDTSAQNLSLTINKAVLTVTAANQTMTYGSSLPALAATYSGFVNGDTAAALSGSPSVTTTANQSSAPGTYPITAAQGTLSAANYTFNFAPGTLTIAKASLTASVVAASKVYDGTTAATISGCTLAGVLSGDAANVNCTATSATFADASAGAEKSVTAAGINLGGTAAGNYLLSNTSATTTANISAAPLTPTVTVNNKAYDGTTAATIATRSVAGVIGSDTVNLTGGTAAFAGPNVGNGIAVNVTGLSLSGTAAANYQLTSNAATSTANITPAVLTVSGVSANSKVYDGTTSATLNFGGAGLSGVVGSDNVTLNSAGYTATFASKNVANSVPIAVANVALGGTAAGNYTLTQPTGLAANITAKQITFGGLTANNKVYDGTTTATLSGNAVLTTAPVTGDTVSLSGAAAGTFSDAAVRTAKTVTVSGLTLTGADAGDYALSGSPLAADITPALLTPAVTVSNKAYDGTTAAIISNRSLTGVIGSDNVSLTGGAAVFGSPNVATGIAVNITGLSLTGTAMGNYQLSSTSAATTANITAASLTPLVTVNNKQYDGTTAATIATRSLTGVIGSDNVTLTGGTASFATPNAGTAVAVNATGLNLTGTAAGNYQLASTSAATTANITAASLTPSITVSSKQYDGTTAATISGRSLSGVIGSDDVTLSGGTATFASPNAGTAIAVNATGLTLAGAAAGNYQLSAMMANASANITPAPLTVTANNMSWTQGGMWPPAYSASYTGFVNGETAAVLGGALNFNTTATASSPIGMYPITPSGLTSNNYAISFVNGTLDINALPLAITTVSLPNGIAGANYSQQLMSSGGASPITWTLAGGNLPSGYNISGTGAISGSTNVTGTFTFTVQAQDSSPGAQQQTKTQQLSLTINPVLAISTTSLANGNTGMAYSQQLASTGGTAPITWSFVSGSLPQGIGLSSSGLISGSTGATGTFNFTVRATDSGTPQQNITQNLSITINQAIYVTLSPGSQQNLTTGGTATFTPTVFNDATNKGVNFSLNPASGCGTVAPMSNVNSGSQVTYTAPTTLNNPCQVTITATSLTDNTKSAQVMVNVNLPLSLPMPNQNTPGPAIVGVNYNGFINAMGGVGPYTWTVTGLSDNLTYNGNNGGSTLSISGTPTTAGTVTFNVTVKDNTGAQAGPLAYTINVNTPTPLTLQQNQLPSATTGSVYMAGINANGGIPGYSFTVNGTVVPTDGTQTAVPNGNGLTVSNTSGNTLLIGGTPTTAGTVALNVTVKDSLNNSVSQAYSVTINNPMPLTVDAHDLGNGLINVGYSAWLNVQGGSGNYSNYVLSYTGTLPPGISLGSQNCTTCLTGTPTEVGTYSFTINVSDSTIPGSHASADGTIVISNGPDGKNNGYLFGHYAILFRGFVDNQNNNGPSTSHQSAAVASFSADGSGHINGGLFFVNDSNGVKNNASGTPFTGTYSIGADNRGIMTLNTCVTSSSCVLNNQMFAFSAGQIRNVSLVSGTCPTSQDNTACPLYNEGSMVEFDDAGTTPSGVHGQAQLFRQGYGTFDTVADFQTYVNGTWVFGFDGEDSTYNPLASAGLAAMQIPADGATTTGAIPSGASDINDNETVSAGPLNLSGADTFSITNATTTNGQFKGTLHVTNAPVGYPTNYRFFMIDSNRMMALSWDPHNQGSMVAGILYKQKASHASMPSAAVMYMAGAGGQNSTDAMVLQATCDSNGACTINASDENDAGTYKQNQMAGAPFSAMTTANGRVTLGGVGSQPPIFYLYDSSATGGAVMLSTGGVQLGRMYAQGAVPGSIGPVAGSFYMSNVFSPSADSGSNAGVLTMDGSGNVSVTQDDGGQGYTSYGNSMSGMTIPSISNLGLFNVTGGAQTQVVCYLIQPVCTAGATSCGTSSSPYGMFACVSPNDNNPKVTLVQQVQ